MKQESIWNTLAETHAYPALDKNLSVETAIIGGGITGLSVAQLLSENGHTTAVLEARKIGFGTTGASTGNLYVTVDQLLSPIRSKYGDDMVKEVVASRRQAMELMERNVSRFGIDCDFKRQPMYLYADGAEGKIETEVETARLAGLGIAKAGAKDLPIQADITVRIDDQAQFNPARYMQGLAAAIRSDRCRLYENTAVTDVTENADGVVVRTTGGTVTAAQVVFATHTPKGVMLTQTLVAPYREYGIAFRLKEAALPEGIIWGFHGSDGKKYSIRSYTREGEHYAVVVGEQHKVGKVKDTMETVKALEDFARRRLPVGKSICFWGGQNYRPADLLPYIGKTTDASRQYIATGYATDGLVYGVLAARIITNGILGKTDPHEKIYDAGRNRPVKAARKFVSEGLDVAAQYLAHIPGAIPREEFSTISRGEGKVLIHKGQKVAAHRTHQGELIVRSAICPHMACVVNWNNAEQSWDCPCHGSRFEPDGSVLEGPAYKPLHKIEPKDE